MSVQVTADICSVQTELFEMRVMSAVALMFRLMFSLGFVLVI